MGIKRHPQHPSRSNNGVSQLTPSGTPGQAGTLSILI